MSVTPPRPRRSPWRLALVVLWVLLGLMTSVMAVLIGFLFDAPGSTSNPYLIQAAWGLAALPLTFFIGAVGLLFAQTPWVRIVLIALPLVAAGVVMHGFAKIDSVCGGAFACPKAKT